MNLMKSLSLAMVFCLCIVSGAVAQTTRTAVTDADALSAINSLRTELVDAFNKGDVDRLISHLDPDVVITWQNGEVSRGPDGVKAYYNKMMTGENRIVQKLSAEPTVDDRHIYGDWAVSWGNLHDEYTLNDGKSFKFDSRFTATIAKRGAEWKVVAFHASVNAFDNPILRMAASKVGTWAGIIGGVIGLFVGLLIGRMRGKRPAPTAAT
jgi:ketosteroid isomerase-like protein